MVYEAISETEALKKANKKKCLWLLMEKNHLN